MNEKQLKALEKRIQVLEDIEAIKDLKARYAAVCD
ncbi:MAG: nuclear transport factor 2 family protein, partial [Deltaproteobacteria bacterium]|nr:nuclear transport factor 2 family protein [Deltaproteobacteria bacterium]